MKTFLIIAIAAASLSFTATQAQAGSYRHSSGYCAPYRVSTCEVSRCSYCQTAYDRCGYPYHYTVTVVTYRDSYSDGSSRTYTSSFRS